jgi:uncharacterized repeat protein (TIGR01451 family)
MKRFFIRTATLAVIAFLGIVAILYAQRVLRQRELAANARKAVAQMNRDAHTAGTVSNQENRSFLPADQSSLWQRQNLGPPETNSANPPIAQAQTDTAPSPFAPQGQADSAGYSEQSASRDSHVLQVVSEAELTPPPSDQTELWSQLQPVATLPLESAPLSDPPAEATPHQTPAEPLPRGDAEQALPAPLSQQPLALEAADEERPEFADPMPVDQPPDFTQDPPIAAPGDPATDFPAVDSSHPRGLQEGTGRPGSQDLEGVQGAALSVEKVAPPELQVGRAATFQIKVRNTGTSTAKQVEVIDVLPKGARFAAANPPAQETPHGELIWNLGRLRAGEETTLAVELVPLVEGEIGSVATARFAAEASARAIATRPQLVLQVSGPSEVLIGQEARLNVKVTNVGTGAASGVTLLDQLPPNFSHDAGQEVEYSVGVLAAKETREIELTLTAAKAGRVTNTIIAYGDGNLRAEDQLEIEVLAPSLDVRIDGSERRFLERQAVYTLTLANPGTAPAKSVELRAQLPASLQFVEANNLGEYEAATRTVHWRLEELPAGESGSVTLIAMPTIEGEQRLTVEASTGQGLRAKREQRVIVEGVAGTSFEVLDASDPIEVGGETTYEIRVLNQGTKAATNVRVAMVLPDGMRIVGAEGPSAHLVQGNQIAFEPLPRLAPKADTAYQVRVQAVQPGDMRVRVQLLSDEMRTPVTKEESTRVFGNE